MSYVKQTWVTGDIITADKLNHMEDGISNAGLKVFEMVLNEETELVGIQATPEEMDVGSVIVDNLNPNNSGAYFVSKKYVDDENNNADTIVTIGVIGTNVTLSTYFYDKSAGIYRSGGIG